MKHDLKLSFTIYTIFCYNSFMAKHPFEIDPEEFKKDMEELRPLVENNDIDGIVAWLNRKNPERVEEAAAEARESAAQVRKDFEC